MIRTPFSHPFSLTLLLLPALLACSERSEGLYPTYKAALDAGEISRGSIPSWLPESATTIRSMHDINTNQIVLTFRFEPGDADALKRLGESVDPSGIPGPPFDVYWWPPDVPPSALEAQLHDYYECEDGRAWLAVSLLRGEACYWRH